MEMKGWPPSLPRPRSACPPQEIAPCALSGGQAIEDTDGARRSLRQVARQSWFAGAVDRRVAGDPADAVRLGARGNLVRGLVLDRVRHVDRVEVARVRAPPPVRAPPCGTRGSPPPPSESPTLRASMSRAHCTSCTTLNRRARAPRPRHRAADRAAPAGARFENVGFMARVDATRRRSRPAAARPAGRETRCRPAC